MRRVGALLLIAALLGAAAMSAALSQEPPPPEPVPPPEEPPPESPQSQPAADEPPAVEPSEESVAPVLPEAQTDRTLEPKRSRPRRPKTLPARHDDLVRKMAALEPKGIYVLIDTGTNRLYLMRGKCILRAAVCSTGSGRFLPDPPRNREWTFDTPKGEFRIQRKFVKPVWIKPDWAFIEEGEPLPKDYEERVAPEELGDYAMDLGDGYLIHGTLYERALGLSVTHGCVRLGAKDLEAIFHTVRIGTPVYIF